MRSSLAVQYICNVMAKYVTFDFKQKTLKVFLMVSVNWDMICYHEGLFCLLFALYQDCRHVAKPGGKKVARKT